MDINQKINRAHLQVVKYNLGIFFLSSRIEIFRIYDTSYYEYALHLFLKR